MTHANSFRGHVDENGVLYLNDARGYAALLKSLAGKKVAIKVGKPQRSDNQRRFYFGVIVKILADEWGYNPPEQMHDALREEFLRLEADPEHGKPLPTVRSTSDLNTAEFEDYLDRIRAWAATDYGIVLPFPNEEI